MPKIIERWLLFKYIGGEFTPLSKPLKKKEQAEKARQKYRERERKASGIGAIRAKGSFRFPLAAIIGSFSTFCRISS
jgi:hypothetical protein